jgi:hypothetical protein
VRVSILSSTCRSWASSKAVGILSSILTAFSKPFPLHGAAVLVVTCLLLVPSQGTVVAGVEVLAVGVVDWAAIVAIQVLQLRNWHSLEASLRWHLVPRVVLGQVATLPMVAAGIAVLSWGVSGLYVLVAGVVLSFLVAVGDAWVLLVEIKR